jgi:hypothetical protein
MNAISYNLPYHEGVSADYNEARRQPCLFLLDDLLNEMYSRQVCDLFAKGSHHRNISVILFTQHISSRQAL